jgi:hypothetical protein
MRHNSYEMEGMDARVGSVSSQLPVELAPASPVVVEVIAHA